MRYKHINVRTYHRKTKKGVTKVKAHSKAIPVINPKERKVFKFISNPKEFSHEYGGVIDFGDKGQIEQMTVIPGKSKEVEIPDFEVTYHTHPSKHLSLPTPDDIVGLVKNKRQQAEIVFRDGEAFVIQKTKKSKKLSKVPEKKLYKEIDKLWVKADKRNDEQKFKRDLEKEGFSVIVNNDTSKPIRLKDVKVMQ